ncbi:MAG TPA: hypothetical protein DDY13_18875 [Cytophagales bacterium]|nr:hypothetical protein [Cytophagales bacterium]
MCKTCLKDWFFELFLLIFISSYITRRKYKIIGYKTKIQLINRAESEQWYINFPAAFGFTTGIEIIALGFPFCLRGAITFLFNWNRAEFLLL